LSTAKPIVRSADQSAKVSQGLNPSYELAAMSTAESSADIFPTLTGPIRNVWYRALVGTAFPLPELGGHVMRLSSSFVAPSTVAILATALLCGLSGAAVSQTATGSDTQLPKITVEAPTQVARPQRPEVTRQRSGRVAHRAGRTSRSTQTATGTPSTARGPVMVKLARLERQASSCNDGCESSVKRGKDPWVGCSESAGYYSVYSATCKDTLTHRDYVQCMETKMFLGEQRNRAWWYCNGMLAGGKFRVTAENRNR
jgi:hypothetical protein